VRRPVQARSDRAGSDAPARAPASSRTGPAPAGLPLDV